MTWTEHCWIPARCFGLNRCVLEKKGLPDLGEEVFRTFIGPPIKDSFREVFGLQGKELEEAVFFSGSFMENIIFYAQNLIREGKQVFEYLVENNIKPAVATYKRHDYMELLMKHFGFDKYTDILNGADSQGRLTKGDIIRNCIKQSGDISFSETLMIGDTGHDAKGALEIGIDFAGVTYGFEFKNEEEVNKYPNVAVIGEPLDIMKII